MAKDFNNIKAGKVKNTIAAATQETQEVQEIHETQDTRKKRRTYTNQEAAEFLKEMNTSGRKGLKLPRINIGFSPDVYDYVKTMANAAGMNYTDFVNKVLRDHMESHQDVYQRAVDIRNSI